MSPSSTHPEDVTITIWVGFPLAQDHHLDLTSSTASASTHSSPRSMPSQPFPFLPPLALSTPTLSSSLDCYTSSLSTSLLLESLPPVTRPLSTTFAGTSTTPSSTRLSPSLPRKADMVSPRLPTSSQQQHYDSGTSLLVDQTPPTDSPPSRASHARSAITTLQLESESLHQDLYLVYSFNTVVSSFSLPSESSRRS